MRRSNPRISLVCNAAVFVLILCGVGHAASAQNEQSQRKPDQIAKPDGNHDAAFHFAEADRLYVELPGEIGYDKLRQLQLLWPSELTERQRLLLREWTVKNTEALTQLRLGIQKAQHANPSKDSPAPGWQGAYGTESDKLVELTRMAIFRVKFTAAERGMNHEAEDNLLTYYRWGRGITQSTSLADYNLGIGIQACIARVVFDILARMPVDTAAMLRLQTCLEQSVAAGEDLAANIIRGEKLRFLPSVRRAFEGTDPESKLKHDEALYLAVELDLTSEQMDVFDLRYGRTTQDFEAAYAYCYRFLSLSPSQARAEGLDFWKDLTRLTHENPVTNLVMLNGPRIARIGANCSAYQDALAATLALLRYRAEKGSFPETLQELVSAGFAARLPMDPYSDKPLVYRRTDADFVLYSWGGDFDDDGGQRSDWGQGKEGGDQVFWPVQPSIAKK
jgi:hypothetical protein